MTLSDGLLPDLAVVVLVPDRLETVARTLEALTAQTIRERLEIVLVTPMAELAVPAHFGAAFAGGSVVRSDLRTSTARARVAGIRAARAPLVAFAEDHCFPTPTWAAALVGAHAERWAGVGPAVVNANPTALVSWANLLIEYGPWLGPCRGGEWAHIPGHNSCYKRAVLLACGDRLASLMEAESVLQWTLQRDGHRFAIEPSAHTRHENFSRVRPSLVLRFHSGRLFAASRSLQWNVARRLLYVAAAPLIPLVRVWRANLDRKRIEGAQRRRGLMTVTFALLTADAAGELAGYCIGAGHAATTLADFEFHRERFLTARERAARRDSATLTPERA